LFVIYQQTRILCWWFWPHTAWTHLLQSLKLNKRVDVLISEDSPMFSVRQPTQTVREYLQWGTTCRHTTTKRKILADDSCQLSLQAVLVFAPLCLAHWLGEGGGWKIHLSEHSIKQQHQTSCFLRTVQLRERLQWGTTCRHTHTTTKRKILAGDWCQLCL
jgi:hypothetical protein